jgi:hypothetical protein
MPRPSKDVIAAIAWVAIIVALLAVFAPFVLGLMPPSRIQGPGIP